MALRSLRQSARQELSKFGPPLQVQRPGNSFLKILGRRQNSNLTCFSGEIAGNGPNDFSDGIPSTRRKFLLRDSECLPSSAQ